MDEAICWLTLNIEVIIQLFTIDVFDYSQISINGMRMKNLEKFPQKRAAIGLLIQVKLGFLVVQLKKLNS
jgi:hypothetical protein